jgi:hypothetical protein
MAKVVTIELRAETKDAQRELDLITKEIREQKEITIEFEKELLKLEQQLKRTPKNALGQQRKLRSEISKVKDALKDQRIGLKELNLERSDATKAAKGFTVANRDLADQVSKNYGVTGLLNQLTGGLASRYRDAYDAVTGLNKGLKGLKGALLATGIGAAVVAIGLLVKNFDKVKEAITGVTAEQKRFIETQSEASIAANEASQSLRSLRDVVLDETATQEAREQALFKLSETVTGLNDVTLDQEDALKKVTEATDPYIKAVEARAKAEAFAKIIAEEEANIIREQQKNLTEQVGTLDFIKAGFLSIGNAAKFSGKLSEQAFSNQQSTIDKSKTLIAELQTQYQNFLTTALDLESGIAGGVNEVVRGTVESIGTITTTGVQSVVTTTETGITTNAELKKQSKSLSDAEIKRMQLEADWQAKTTEQKVATVQNGLAGIAANLGKETAAGKAAAIASATISTYQGATDSYKSLAGIPIVGPALGFAAAAAAVAAGFANIKAITSTKTPQTAGMGSGGSAPSVARPSAPTSAPPAFNIVGAGSTSQLAEAIGSQAQEPVRAYVVSGDVSTAQELDRNIVQGASIG